MVHSPHVRADRGHDAVSLPAHGTFGEPLVLLHVVEATSFRLVRPAADRALKMAAGSRSSVAAYLRSKMADTWKQTDNPDLCRTF